MRTDPFALYHVLRRDCTSRSRKATRFFTPSRTRLCPLSCRARPAWIVLIRQEDEFELSLWIGAALAIAAPPLLIFQKVPIRLTVTAFGIEIQRYHFWRGGRALPGRPSAVLMIIPPLELNEENPERAATKTGRRLGMTAQKG